MPALSLQSGNPANPGLCTTHSFLPAWMPGLAAAPLSISKLCTAAAIAAAPFRSPEHVELRIWLPKLHLSSELDPGSDWSDLCGETRIRKLWLHFKLQTRSSEARLLGTKVHLHHAGWTKKANGSSGSFTVCPPGYCTCCVIQEVRTQQPQECSK